MNPKAREHRFRRLKEIGCLACWMIGIPDVYPEIHHQNLGEHAGQKRLGDEFTVPLCEWHHQGHLFINHSEADMVAARGPSLKRHPVEFRKKFGSDAEQLTKVNDLIRQRDELAFGWRKGPLPEAHQTGLTASSPHTGD